MILQIRQCSRESIIIKSQGDNFAEIRKCSKLAVRHTGSGQLELEVGLGQPFHELEQGCHSPREEFCVNKTEVMFARKETMCFEQVRSENFGKGDLKSAFFSSGIVGSGELNSRRQFKVEFETDRTIV